MTRTPGEPRQPPLRPNLSDPFWSQGARGLRFDDLFGLAPAFTTLVESRCTLVSVVRKAHDVEGGKALHV